MKPYSRIPVPRGLVAGTALAVVVVWALWAAAPQAWPGLVGALVQTALLLVNVVVTTWLGPVKRGVVRRFQRWVLNPVVKLLMAAGLNPLGLVVLETRGRVSGLPRRTPVGNGRDGDLLWIIAEHGARAGYVRNIAADPRVRVRLRVGWRTRWVDGVAEALPADDAVARQRRLCRRHPLRAANAVGVRLLGTDLLTVCVRLRWADDTRADRASETMAACPSSAPTVPAPVGVPVGSI